MGFLDLFITLFVDGFGSQEAYNFENELFLGPPQDGDSRSLNEAYRVPDTGESIEVTVVDHTSEKRFEGWWNRRRYPSPQQPEQTGASAGFRAAVSQWRGESPRPWYRLESYDFLGIAEVLSRVESRTGRAGTDLVKIEDPKYLHCARTVRKLRLEDMGDGNVKGRYLPRLRLQ